MFSNAVFSILQTTLLVHPAFYRAVDPKMMLYQFVIRVIEYDKTQSKAVIDAIKTGEETFSEKAIKEEDLVESMEDIIKNMNVEKYEQKNNAARQ